MKLYQNRTKSITITSETNNLGLGLISSSVSDKFRLSELVFFNIHVYIINKRWQVSDYGV